MAKIHNKRKKNTLPKTRKELRKEKRAQKKQNKREFFSRKNKSHEKPSKEQYKSKKDLTENVDSEIESNFDLSDEDVNSKLKRVKKEIPNDRFHLNQIKEKKKQNELQNKMRKRRIEQLKSANEEEDKVIRKLEKRLKIDKHKNDKSVHKMFNDGLDYALELCLPENIEKMYAAAKEAAEIEGSDEEFAEDMAIALDKKRNASQDSTKREKKVKSIEKSSKSKQVKLSKIERKYFKDDFESDVSGTDSEFGEESSDEKMNRISYKQGPEKHERLVQDSEDSDFDIGDDEEDDELSEFEQADESDSNVSLERSVEETNEDVNNENKELNSDEQESTSGDQRSDTVWEDIYGRKRDKEGHVIEDTAGKYIPPHIRARLSADGSNDKKNKEKLECLNKQCKGLLNKLSEANMHKISSDIENMYMRNPRYDMNNTLSNLIMEAIINKVWS